MNAGRLGVPGVDAAGHVDLMILAEHAQSKHPRDGGDAVVGKSDHQAGDSIPGECPDERGANAVADLAGDLVDWFGELVVVAKKVGSGLVVPTPKRQIVDPDVCRMRDDLFVVSNFVFVDLEFLRIAGGETNFTDRSGPGRTIAERLDLSVLNEDRVGTQPIARTH